MKAEAWHMMRQIYQGNEQVLKRLQFLGQPDIELDWDAVERYEEEQREIEERRKNRVSAMDIFKNKTREAVEKWQQHRSDCGSSEVQIAITHERIQYLTRHLLANKHDYVCKRSLIAAVTKRRKLLEYLYTSKKYDSIRKLVRELDIRFVPPDQHIFDKKIKYAVFKNTKAKIAAKRKRKTVTTR
jgi:small subunit ribosomal protein S15